MAIGYLAYNLLRAICDRRPTRLRSKYPRQKQICQRNLDSDYMGPCLPNEGTRASSDMDTISNWRAIMSPIVLLYHSISKPGAGSDVFDIQVDPAVFRRQIRTLSEAYEVVSLAELFSDLRNGVLRPNRVTITFDDGYANNLDVAVPILREFGAPATLFVCTGFLGRNAYWWDRLVDIIYTATRIPPRLSELESELGLGRSLFASDYASSLGSPHGQKDIVLKIWNALRLLAVERIDYIIARLESWFEPVGQTGDRRPMSADEVNAAGRYFAIGAHSITHPVMRALSEETLTAEILGSKQSCEELTGQTVDSFAYPYGEFDAMAMRVTSRHVTHACTTKERSLSLRTHPLAIPRLNVGNWSPNQLAAKMQEVVQTSLLPPPLRLARDLMRQPRWVASRLISAIWRTNKRFSG